MNETNFSNIPYLPHTEGDRQSMLESIGKRTFEELISHIPKEVRAKELDLRDGLSELELSKRVTALAMRNKPTSDQSSFLGGGSYRRYVPAVVGNILSRSEFATAYTPYQPEVSQGSLQAIYEFQTAICLLTSMDVANASMYDGPTACAEAALMAARLTNRHKIVVSKTVNPEYSAVTKTYVKNCGLELVETFSDGGTTTITEGTVDAQVAAVVVQYPNHLGILEDIKALAESTHAQGALLVVITDPISLGLLTPPGEFGADIVVGDAQSCGNNLSFGGPSAGYMACRKDYIRQLPGRLAGMTVDNRGQKAFTLTLQTREQHIRRAKATSNICTNQALNALAMLIYLAFMGPQGLQRLANISLQRAHYLASKLTAIPGVSLLHDKPFFSEFAIKVNVPVENLLDDLKERGILGGISLGKFDSELSDAILVSVTEMNDAAELDNYAKILQEILASQDQRKSKQTSGSTTTPICV
jgi:glycine dehydrogenase subunit 1